MSLIKDGCMFINTARADLVDEEAFMESMKLRQDAPLRVWMCTGRNPLTKTVSC